MPTEEDLYAVWPGGVSEADLTAVEISADHGSAVGPGLGPGPGRDAESGGPDSDDGGVRAWRAALGLDGRSGPPSEPAAAPRLDRLEPAGPRRLSAVEDLEGLGPMSLVEAVGPQPLSAGAAPAAGPVAPGGEGRGRRGRGGGVMTTTVSSEIMRTQSSETTTV